MLAISHAWDGHPGTLVKAFPAVGLPVGMSTLGECSAANPGSTGWALRNGSLLAPASSSASAQLQPQCMVGIQQGAGLAECTGSAFLSRHAACAPAQRACCVRDANDMCAETTTFPPYCPGRPGAITHP